MCIPFVLLMSVPAYSFTTTVLQLTCFCKSRVSPLVCNEVLFSFPLIFPSFFAQCELFSFHVHVCVCACACACVCVCACVCALVLTVSAAVRFIPSPPALVLSRNTKMSDLGRETDTCTQMNQELSKTSRLSNT